MAVEEVTDGSQVQADVVGHDARRAAAGEHGIQVYQVRIKAIACVGAVAAARVHREVPVRPACELGQVAMQQHGALGRARGARGVQQHGEVARLDVGVKGGRVGELQDGVRVEHRAGPVLQEARQVPVRDEEGGPRILHHEGQPLLGIAGVQRLIGGTGLQHAKGRQRHVLAAVDEDRHDVALADSLVLEVGRHGVGDAVHLLVGVACLLRDDGDMVRMVGRGASELRDDVRGVAGLFVLVQAVQQAQLGLSDEQEILQRILCEHLGDDLAVGARKALCPVLAVRATVVAQRDLAGPVFWCAADKRQLAVVRCLRAVAKEEGKVQPQSLGKLRVGGRSMRGALLQPFGSLLDQLGDAAPLWDGQAEGDEGGGVLRGGRGPEEDVFLTREDGGQLGKGRGEERLGRAFCRGAEVAHPLLVNGDGQGEALWAAVLPAVGLWPAFRLAVGEALGPERGDALICWRGALVDTLLDGDGDALLERPCAHGLPPRRTELAACCLTPSDKKFIRAACVVRLALLRKRCVVVCATTCHPGRSEPKASAAEGPRARRMAGGGRKGARGPDLPTTAVFDASIPYMRW